MNHSTEDLRADLQLTKQRLANSFNRLENQLSESLTTTGSTVQATAEVVQEAVQAVSNTFNPQLQYRQHPWLILGGSVLLGFLASRWAFSSRQRVRGANRDDTPEGNRSAGPATERAIVAPVLARHPQETESLPTLASSLKTIALNGLTNAIQNSVSQGIPILIQQWATHKASLHRPPAWESPPAEEAQPKNKSIDSLDHQALRPHREDEA